MPGLDTIDRSIIRALRRNARVSNVQLAAEVGLSPPACLRRVHLLEERGTIRGYTVVVAGMGGAADIQVVIVRIRLERQTEEVLKRFEADALKHPEILECYLMTGEEDYLLRVGANGAGDYERIHKDVLSPFRASSVSTLRSLFEL